MTHKKQANKASWQVWIWQFITVGALVLFITFAYKAASVAQNASAEKATIPAANAVGASAPPAPVGGFNWTALAGRIYFSLATGLLAAFGASQVARYQHVEGRNRKLELELQALGPFLEPLPEEKRVEIREKIADRSFGRDDGALVTAGPTNVFDLLKTKEGQELLELIGKVADAAKDTAKKG